MGTVYVTQPDAFIGKSDERLQVRSERQTILDVPLLKVEGLVILGRATISAAALAELLARNITTTYLSATGHYLGKLEPELNKNVIVRSAQWHLGPARALALCQSFVRGKLKNSRIALQRAQRDHQDIDLSDSIHQIQSILRNLDLAESIDSLRGYEGAGSAAYFKAMPHLIRNPDFTFKTRQRRPPCDPVNALLSLGYALLRHDIQGAVNLVGLDPYCGYLHTERYGRPSLVLDLMEEFRPLVVDAVVLTALNRGALTATEFMTEPVSGAVSLSGEGLKTFLRLYEQKKQSRFKHPVMQKQCSYREAFEIQARFCAKFLLHEIDTYPPLVLR